jgi:small-conductance mechanosensitive channel
VTNALAVALVARSALALNAGLGPPPPEVDRHTPLASAHGFLNAAHDGQYGLAAHYLQLDRVRKADQPAEGARLARRLRFVIDRKVWVNFANIHNESQAGAGERDWEELGSVSLQRANHPIRLTRVPLGDQQFAWVFGAETVGAIDELYAAYGPPLGEVLPMFFFSHVYLDLELWQWMGLALALAFSFVGAHLLARGIVALESLLSRWIHQPWFPEVQRSALGPLRLLFSALFVAAAARPLLLTPPAMGIIDTAAHVLFIASIAWLALGIARVVGRSLEQRVASQFEVASRARGIRTQVNVLGRVLSAVIYIVAVGFILMQFSTVRHLGVSVLASAGVAGLVVGLAAQKSISTLLAGIQLSITQPIRIGDTVVVESESGTIEEITLTYVMIKLWDLRRLVMPVTYFLEKPFQNWSKSGATTLVMIALHATKVVDVNALRVELLRLLRGDGKELWDGQIQEVLTTPAPDGGLRLLVHASARDAEAAGRLRALLEERLHVFLERTPAWLPEAERQPTGSRDAEKN